MIYFDRIPVIDTMTILQRVATEQKSSLQVLSVSFVLVFTEKGVKSVEKAIRRIEEMERVQIREEGDSPDPLSREEAELLKRGGATSEGNFSWSESGERMVRERERGGKR